MTAFPEVFLPALPAAAEAAARHAASAAISGVWEGLLLVTATAVLLRAVPGTTARLRFAIWTMVFLVLALLPLFNGFWSGGAAEFAVAASPLRFGVAPVRVDPRWSYALAGLWMAAVALRLGNLGVEARRLRRLWRSAVPAPAEALTGLDMPLGRVQICTSAELDRPSVIGFLAPRILIPEWLFGQLAEGELRQIVLHEMEHLRRRDDWMNLLQKVALVLFPLNPALVWIDRRLATERELACDDGVLSRTQAPRAYATCLTSLAERQIARRMAKPGHGRLTALALGALGVIRRSEFSQRIESILSRRQGLSPAMGRVFAVLFAAGVLGAGSSLAHAPALVAFNSSALSSTPPEVAATPVAAESRVAASESLSAPHMQNVVFHPHPAEMKAGPAVVRQPVKDAIRSKPRTALGVPVKQADAVLDPEMQAMAQFEQVVQRQVKEQQRLMILTDWQEPMAVPVLVTLPDGRIFLATYTATPTKAGWIVFQL